MARQSPKATAKKRAGAEHYDLEGMDPEMVGTLRGENMRRKGVAGMTGSDSSGTLASKSQGIVEKIKGFFKKEEEEIMRTENKAGMKVLQDVVPIDKIAPRIDRFKTIQEGLVQRRAMLDEIHVLGKYTQARGFSPGRDFQRVATIPPSVWSAVLEVFPEAGTDKKLFYELLAGPLKDYDIRFKPSLT